MDNIMQFSNRNEFRIWLANNALSNFGIWLLFEKSMNSKTLMAHEALEEALCFGWIDGQIKKIDDKTYMKYFCQRKKNSKWSPKNKDLTKDLIKRGLMTDFGILKINEAKKSGKWEEKSNPPITEEEIQILISILKNYELAYAHFLKMPLSIQKTYTRAYFDAKTDDGREKRIAWIVDRLNKKLKPM